MARTDNSQRNDRIGSKNVVLVYTNQNAPMLGRVGMGNGNLRIACDNGGPAANMCFFDEAMRMRAHKRC